MSEDRTILDVLKAIAEILALPAAYLFFTGFLYAYYYFKHFRISLQNLELSPHFYLIYAFSVFYVKWPSVLLVIILVAAMAVYGHKKSANWAQIGVIVSLLLLFPALWVSARDMGEERAILLRNGYGARLLNLAVTTESQAGCGASVEGAPERRLCIDSTYQYFLLAQTDDFLVVLDQETPPQLPELPAANVHWIPKGDVALASITILNAPKVAEDG